MDEPALRDEYEVAVVGAGPAGLAAASIAARHGAATVVFDDQPAPGGRLYRAIASTPLADRAILGEQYWNGAKLVREYEASGAQHVGSATVRSVSPALEIDVAVNGASRRVRAKRVILAPGALERPFPLAGATLHGVAMAGAAQRELQCAGRVPEGAVVLAGTGLYLWTFAAQCLRAGARIAALLDTTPAANRAAARGLLPGFFFSPYWKEWRALQAEVRRRVPVVDDVTQLQAEGDGALREVVCRAGGAQRRIGARSLVLHQGLVPDTRVALACGAEHRWDEVQLCMAPLLDGRGGSTVPGVFIAGDAAGIAGGQVAAWRGVIIGLAAVRALRPVSHLPVERLAFTALHRYLRGRRYFDRLHRPAPQFLPA